LERIWLSKATMHSAQAEVDLQSRAQSIPLPPLHSVESPSQQGAATATTRPCTHPTHKITNLFPARDFITGQEFKVAHCAECGFAVTTPQPGPHEIAGYYPAGYYGAAEQRRFPGIVENLQNALYTLRVREVEAVAEVERGAPGGPEKRRVLDVGCGRGVLLQEFRRRGWEVQGTELSEQAASYARQSLKMPVEIGSLETIHFPANHFDAITLWHVLEHVTNPRALLAEINRILKPGGVLLVSVPNFGSFEARVSKDKWFHLDVPRHITHFSEATLRETLGEKGFEVRHKTGFAPEYDSFSFVQSVLNLCGLRHNLLYDVVRGKTAKVLSGEPAPKWQILASFVLGAFLGILSFPATLLAGFLGQGGTISLLATKQAQPSPYSKDTWSLLTPDLKRRLAQP
jgi:2-polyprenyl-3-methyl-5-hydroxy-6-metoxy-1,4-benzoquinol methylase